MYEIEVTCEDCNGTGWIEIIGSCSLPASACCGGCVKDVECKICDGDGFYWEKQEEEAEEC